MDQLRITDKRGNVRVRASEINSKREIKTEINEMKIKKERNVHLILRGASLGCVRACVAVSETSRINY